VVGDFTSDSVPDLVVPRPGSLSDSGGLFVVNGDGTFQGAVWQWGGSYSKGLDVTADTGGAVAAGEWQRQLIHTDKQAYMAKSPRVDFSKSLMATLQESTGVLGTLLKEAKFEVGAAFVPQQTQFGCPRRWRRLVDHGRGAQGAPGGGLPVRQVRRQAGERRPVVDRHRLPAGDEGRAGDPADAAAVHRAPREKYV
jgi:hypothetical protein